MSAANAEVLPDSLCHWCMIGWFATGWLLQDLMWKSGCGALTCSDNLMSQLARWQHSQWRGSKCSDRRKLSRWPPWTVETEDKGIEAPKDGEFDKYWA